MLPNSGQRCGEAGDCWGQRRLACGRAVDKMAGLLWTNPLSTPCGRRLATNPHAADLPRCPVSTPACGSHRDNFPLPKVWTEDSCPICGERPCPALESNRADAFHRFGTTAGRLGAGGRGARDGFGRGAQRDRTPSAGARRTPHREAEGRGRKKGKRGGAVRPGRPPNGGPRTAKGAPGAVPGAPWASCGPASAVLDAVGELGDLVVDRTSLGHQRADLAVGVHHGRMVPAAELRTDLRQ